VLAITGYEAQQTDEPEDPDRPHNLWNPVAGDHGAHGAFDHRARSWSWQLWANTHCVLLALGAATTALGTAMVLAWRPR
jgi:hypothetical protein